MESLEYDIRLCIFQRYTIFSVGMTMGTEIRAAEAVLRLRAEFPHIRLHCYLPCETQANAWPDTWRERYFDVLSQADEVQYTQSAYTPGCVAARTRSMLQNASRLITMQQQEGRQYTPYALRLAVQAGMDIRTYTAKMLKYPRAVGLP